LLHNPGWPGYRAKPIYKPAESNSLNVALFMFFRQSIGAGTNY